MSFNPLSSPFNNPTSLMRADASNFGSEFPANWPPSNFRPKKENQQRNSDSEFPFHDDSSSTSNLNLLQAFGEQQHPSNILGSNCDDQNLEQQKFCDGDLVDKNSPNAQDVMPNGLVVLSQMIPSFSENPEIHFRFLLDSDIPMVKLLCRELFPIDYPDAWYNEITTNPNFFSLAATFRVRSSNNGESENPGANEFIVGMIVAEIKRLTHCNVEDRDILSKTFPANSVVAYILSLGVTRAFRCQGIASRLLDNFLAYLTNGIGTPMGEAKAIYLHVLTTNSQAIRFYEKRHFRRHCKLYDYYFINSKYQDGFTYVLYINGGKPPFGVFEACSLLVSYFCAPVRLTYVCVNRFVGWCMSSDSYSDRDILSKTFPANSVVAYILSLGVTRAFRCQGIASRLLDNFLAYLTNGIGTPMGEAKAIYLHVLTTNSQAIRFYEKRHFRRHCKLYDYYFINSKYQDGFTYVLYINGGKPPFGVFEACSLLVSYFCAPVRLTYVCVNRFVGWCMSSDSYSVRLRNEIL